MKAVEEYLSHVLSTHRTGAAVPETSYYGALQALLNELGKKLKPKGKRWCISWRLRVKAMRYESRVNRLAAEGLGWDFTNLK